MTAVRTMTRRWLLAARGRHADWTPEYDAAGASYDDIYSVFMGKHGEGLVAAMQLTDGDRVLDLGAGTGHLTQAILERVGARGHVRAVDSSSGMLDVARAKLGATHPNVAFERSDMLQALRLTPAGTMDAVTCGWSICYADPVRCLREIRRVLVPGGVVGIIESTADAFSNVNAAYERVVRSDPSFLAKSVNINLPRNVTTLRRWVRRSGLAIDQTWDGSESIAFDSAEEMLLWMNGGAQGAGWLDAIDESRLDDFINRLLDALRPAGEYRLVHGFVATVARTKGGLHAA